MNVPGLEELLEMIDQEARKDFLFGNRVAQNVAQDLKVCSAPQEDACPPSGASHSPRWRRESLK
jgi:hypothetical protein